jgi:hypothetical protein
LIWNCGWLLADNDHLNPNWSGFMQHVCTGEYRPAADILIMPLIDMNPSDSHCIFSTLCFIERQAKRLNILMPCITFDQPLWIKAVEIIQATKMNAVCRLGGFHTIMSYLGSIGCLMGGSGLSEALETCYGPNAIIHMMSGKSVSRSIRGHLLVDAALTIQLLRKLLPNDLSLSNTDETNVENVDDDTDNCVVNDLPVVVVDDDDGMFVVCEPELSHDDSNNNLLTDVSVDESVNVDTLRSLYQHLMDKDKSLNELDLSPFTALLHALKQLKEKLASESRTAKFWVQYLEQIQTLKLFIRAERTCDWNLHLLAVSRMLNLFAAAGHNQYAKCARLYLQMMQDLPNTENGKWLHDQFLNGYHAVRRSERFWGGLSSDLIIEQCLMKCLKTRGGLTHGSGMSESVRLMWVKSLHKTASVNEAMLLLTKLQTKQCDEHAEMGKSRISRDNTDMNKLLSWFEANDPFLTTDNRLCCLSTGLTATDGDGINCDTADEIGAAIHAQMDNKMLMDVVLKKRDQMKTLTKLQKCVTANNKQIFLHTTHLFNRLIVLVERTQDTEMYFCYELTPLPAALFKDSLMRKPNKAALGHLIKAESRVVEDDSFIHGVFVIDGGALLHRVKWPKLGTYDSVIALYLVYVRRHFSESCTIVFDGYDSGPSTKDQEHMRRACLTAANIQVSLSHQVHANQSAFLANAANKSQFIKLLAERLEDDGHSIIQAPGDADTYIAKAAVDLATNNIVATVVADDTDVLVLLVHHFKHNMADIYMLSTCKSGKDQTCKLVSIRSVHLQIGELAVKQLLVVHALSGCDTTSAPFGQGKHKAFKKLALCKKAVPFTAVIMSSSATQNEVGEAGCRLLVMLYGGKSGVTLNKLRHLKYSEMCTGRSGKVIPERLPPTERAAFFHSLRVHLQVMQWSTFMNDNMAAVDWGWSANGSTLSPVYTDQEPAPPEMLNVITCNCKSTSKNQCGSVQCTCRKNGLVCVSACGDCHGDCCMNISKVLNTNDSEASEGEDEMDNNDELPADINWADEWQDDEDCNVDEPCASTTVDLDWQDEEEVMC